MAMIYRRSAMFLGLLSVLVLVEALGGSSTRAQGCAHGICAFSHCHTPVHNVPSDLWGELQPAATGRIPASRDESDFNEHIGRWDLNHYFLSLDVEGGWVFSAANRHLQIWDARSRPEAPLRKWHRERILLPLNWTPSSHPFTVFTDIDAPDGDADVFAVAARQGIGMAVFDSSNKSAPRLLYQDDGGARWGTQVYAGPAGGRQIAVAGADQEGGAFLYDLSAAKALASPCQESQPGASSSCPGVFLGKLGSRTVVRYLDGAGDFIVFSSGSSPRGLELWNVSDPDSPTLALDGLPAEGVYGVALWEESGKLYLGASLTRDLHIYEVSCASANSCSLGTPLWTVSKPFGAELLTFSRSEGRPFLYLAGGTSDCLEGSQNEWLFDVRDPSRARDISPQGTALLNGQAVTYWGWYYRRNGVHGFNHITPKVAKFSGRHLFRAAKGLLDVHRRIDVTLPFFEDGFESGDTTAWDATIP